METAQKLPIVTYLTQIIFHLTLNQEDIDDAAIWQGTVGSGQVRRLGELMTKRTERVAAMMDLLAAAGFEFEVKKNVVYATSDQVEAFEAKQRLLEAGFKDREFQILLEYTRGWGML
ncbi:hypothetical protein SDC9_13612 [bioreactor metagenome]|uniref:Uncharacterized protein n=1 Tax=bioreactor metagenome TaxID=1076179 RepID=A0A644TMM4_9ZZZZ|nr:hypothetical protein [Negativicutes bacterium]